MSPRKTFPGLGRVQCTKARVFLGAMGHDLKCPFCGFVSSSLNSLTWCAQCRRLWILGKDGNYYFADQPERDD